MTPSAQSLVFNGVNGATGEYLLPDMTVAEAARLARGERIDEQHRQDLDIRRRLKTDGTFGMVAGRDPRNLAETGWGVIFAAGADPDVRDALAELLDHRRAVAASIREHRYREYRDGEGYRPGESAYDFLARFGAGIGPANPDKAPYYLLIVGDPETIPFQFQYQLDVERAVGRLHFDRLEDYANYARSVVVAETSVVRPPRAVFFGVRNEDDVATRLSSDHLVAPLAGFCDELQNDWNVETVHGPGEATKARLSRLLGGDDTPALLFTASHGMWFPAEDARLFPHQGGLLCQDWPGKKQHRGRIPPDFYLAGDDIGGDARLLGMIGVHFACFGAGTPRLDDFAHHSDLAAGPLAPHAFVAALPKRLLSHPKGGMLAFVGHVERAWPTSINSPGAGPQIDAFESTLQQLMEGMPVGAAMEFLNSRYAELSTLLTNQLNAIKQTNLIPDDPKLADIWLANNDARSYAVLGDPAVRLSVDTLATGTDATTIEPLRIVTRPAITGTPSASPPPREPVGEVDSHDPIRADGLPTQALPEQLMAALAGMVTSLCRSLDDILRDAAAVHVESYVGDDLANAQFDQRTRRMTCAAQPRAMTHMSANGDTILFVPGDAGVAGDRLWTAHCEAVRQAQAYRTELLKIAASVASSFPGTARSASASETPEN